MEARSRSRPSRLGLALLAGGLVAIGATPRVRAQDSPPPRRIAPSPNTTQAAPRTTPVRSDFDPHRIRIVELDAVEQSIADRGPLDAGLRWMPSGLRLPTGYDQVYTREGGGFWRADGGLVATFGQSVYVPTRSGVAADIPASTVFVIGGVPMGSEPGHGRLLAVDPLDPASIPPTTPVVMVPDELHEPRAEPGDHPTRFGFGPGFRMNWKTDEAPRTTRDLGARFQEDETYRAGRLARILRHWRDAGPSSVRPTPIPSGPEARKDRAGGSRPIPPAAVSSDPGS